MLILTTPRLYQSVQMKEREADGGRSCEVGAGAHPFCTGLNLKMCFFRSQQWKFTHLERRVGGI